MNRITLSAESQEVIKEYIQEKNLTIDIFSDLYNKRSVNGIASVLKEHVALTDELVDKVFLYLIYKVNKNPKTDKNLISFFKESETAFLKELLFNNGVLVSSDVFNWGFRTRWSKAIEKLERANIIETLTLINTDEKVINKFLVIINLDLLFEVKK